MTEPLRKLLEKDIEFNWSFEHEKCLDEVKKILTSAPVMAHYDDKKPLILNTDASSYGLGACIMQDGRPIGFASRSLSKTESRYAQIEKELLSIVFGCERFNDFVWGNKVTVETDHKPLINIFQKPLHEAPPRVMRLLLRLQKYDLTVIHIPGVKMFVSDTLSRALPQVLSVTVNGDSELSTSLDDQEKLFRECFLISDKKWNEIKCETEKDDILNRIRDYILNGWPNSNIIKGIDKLYFNIKECLHVVDGIIFKNNRFVIPSSMRREYLNKLHEGHLGINKCKLLAR